MDVPWAAKRGPGSLMKDERKTKQDLIRELRDLRKRVAMLDVLCITPPDGEAQYCLPVQRLLDSIEDGVVLLDPSLTILSVNKTVERWYSHAMPLVGRKCHDALRHLSIPCPDCAAETCMQNGCTVFREGPRFGPDGQDGWLSYHATPIMDESGRTMAILEVARDITRQKDAEEALRRSEANYRMLVENQVDMVVKLDAAGNVLFASPSLCRALGRSEGELVGSHFSPLVHADDRAMVEGRIAELPGAESLSIELRAVTVNGPRLHQWSLRPVRDEQGQVVEIVGMGRDVEDHRRAVMELEDSERRFRALAENTLTAIFIIQDERFEYVNPAVTAMSGYSREELLGRPFFDLVHPQARSAAKARARARLMGRDIPPRDELPLLTRDGETLWIDFSAAVMEHNGKPAIFGTAVDITRSKSVAQALRNSEALFRSIFLNASVGIAIADFRGCLVQANARFLEMFGYDLWEVSGKSVETLCFPEDMEYSRRITAEMVGGRDSLSLERRYRRKDGSEIFCEVSVSSLRSAEGHTEGFVGVFQDVTERTRATMRLTHAHAERKAILENSFIGIMVLKDRVFIEVNRRFLELFGYTREEVIGRDTRIIHVSEESFQRFGAESYPPLTEKPVAREYPFRRKDGEEMWCRITGQAIEPGDLSKGVVWSVDDITEQRNAEQALRTYAEDLYFAKDAMEENAAKLAMAVSELDVKNEQLQVEIRNRLRAEEKLRESEQRYKELATRDELSGLFNSRQFHSQIQAELRRTKRYGHPLSLIFIDLDDFKRFNDAWGHPEGDKLLASLGDIVGASIRDTDFGFRYGGEEFVVMLPETRLDEAMALSERIRTRFGGLLFSPQPGASVSQTMSVGVAEYFPGESLESFIGRADAAMYQAKAQGKNRCFAAPAPA